MEKQNKFVLSTMMIIIGLLMIISMLFIGNGFGSINLGNAIISPSILFIISFIILIIGLKFLADIIFKKQK